jgi:hypothetical protein
VNWEPLVLIARRAPGGLAMRAGKNTRACRGVATPRSISDEFMASIKTTMTDKTLQAGSVAPAPDDEEIAAAAARLAAKWASERPGNAAHRAAESGQIVQTLEKGRAHMVTVQVKRPRRGAR